MDFDFLSDPAYDIVGAFLVTIELTILSAIGSLIWGTLLAGGTSVPAYPPARWTQQRGCRPEPPPPGQEVCASNPPYAAGRGCCQFFGLPFVLHSDPGLPLTIGKGVTIGHQAMLHGCTVGDGSMIGIAAVVLNATVIGKECLVGAGAVVTERKSFPDRSVIFGSPAKAMREVSEDNLLRMRYSADEYVKRGRQYMKDLKRIG